MRAWQINLQEHLGGGEVYTAFLSRALSQLGVRTTLIVGEHAKFWRHLTLGPDTELARVARPEDISALLPQERAWVLSHGPLPARVAAQGTHLRTAVAHMPPQGRDPHAYANHDLVFAVSGWVLEGLRGIGAPAWDEPLLGVAEARGSPTGEVWASPRYDFDRRKLRDLVLQAVYPAWFRLQPRLRFERRSGLTLGIVSRLTPIKQFPLQFSLLAPRLARHPGVNLEIFGSGGYASVRDLQQALRPLAGRVRFWGHQENVAAAYRRLDYLMTGLPEKEALGLNVIEAQQQGVPVLAVAAPPFTETVVEGETGFRYRDPREDGGADFGRLLELLLSGKRRPDPRLAGAHLARFSFDAFAARIARLLPVVRERLRST